MEARRVVLDTPVLVDFLRDKKEARALIADLENKQTLLSTTAVNAFELYFAAQRSEDREANVQAAEKLLSRLVVLQLTPKSAVRAGQVVAELEAKKQPFSLGDALVGCIALAKDFSVVTRDGEGFAGIRGLNVVAAKPAK